MIDPETAWSRIADELEPLPASRRALEEAWGTVLAEEILASMDLPPADVSAMDGFALAGPRAPGETLDLRGTSAAGHPFGGALAEGEACRIMTGAVVPGGADRILPVEGTEEDDEGTVTVHREAASGDHIRLRGEVVRTGDLLLTPGDRLTPAACSLLAAHGRVRPRVVRTPTVATLATGDELVNARLDPPPGGIRDSNGPLLQTTLSRLGYLGRSLGIAADDPESLRRAIAEGMEDDVLLISGGVSMGERDFVEDVLADLGVRILFEKVAIQPGKPLVAGRHDGGWVFGLPGNPASVLVTFHLFVRPALEALAGRRDAGFWVDAFEVDLGSRLPKGKPRERFLPATLGVVDGRLTASAHAPAGSHDLRVYARGDCLVRIPRGAPAREPGDRVEVLSLAAGPLLGG